MGFLPKEEQLLAIEVGKVKGRRRYSHLPAHF